MNLAQVLAFLMPFEPILKAELVSLEGQGKAELDSLVASVSSPDLKALLSALAAAVDGFAKVEIANLP